MSAPDQARHDVADAGGRFGGRSDAATPTHPADPPRPVPAWLRPLRAQLDGGDQRMVLTLRELDAISAAMRSVGYDLANVMLTQRDGSPWVELDVIVTPEQGLTMGEATTFVREQGALVSFALWRYTLAVYRVGHDGAVDDDPFWRPPGEART